jgi:hypothetical protein
MATVEQCRDALETLAARMAAPDGDPRKRAALDRSMSCHITDLDVTFTGELRDAQLLGISADPAPPAQIRLHLASDDLLALVDGELSFAAAWARGQIKVEANLLDLLRMRSLL